jgi:hypothetical protein
MIWPKSVKRKSPFIFVTALVVVVRFKTNYELINSYFYDYSG